MRPFSARRHQLTLRLVRKVLQQTGQTSKIPSHEPLEHACGSTYDPSPDCVNTTTRQPPNKELQETGLSILPWRQQGLLRGCTASAPSESSRTVLYKLCLSMTPSPAMVLQTWDGRSRDDDTASVRVTIQRSCWKPWSVLSHFNNGTTTCHYLGLSDRNKPQTVLDEVQP